jgi:hypothetical protein
MALARCENCGRPMGRTKIYTSVPRYPASYPESSVVCGKKDCSKPALIWLTEQEQKAYAGGERVFGFDTATVKVRLG